MTTTIDGDSLTTSPTSIGNANSPYLTSGEQYIYVDSSTGAVTVTLASNDAVDGREIRIIDTGESASTNTITIQTEGTENINPGSNSSITLTVDGTYVDLFSDGSNWFSDRAVEKTSGQISGLQSLSTEMLNNAAVVTDDRGTDLGAAVSDAIADQKALTGSPDTEGSPLPVVVMPRSDQIYWDLETPIEIDQNANARLIGWGHIPVRFQADLSTGVLLGESTKLNYFEMAGFNFNLNGHTVGDIIALAAGTRCTFRDMNYRDGAGGGIADSFIALDPAKMTGSEFGYQGTNIVRCHHGGGGEAKVQFDLRHDSGNTVTDVNVENCRVNGSTAAIRGRAVKNCHFGKLFHTRLHTGPLLDLDTEGSKSLEGVTGEKLTAGGAVDVVNVSNSAGNNCRAMEFRNLALEAVGTGDLANVDGCDGVTLHSLMAGMSTADAPYITVGANASDVSIEWPNAREAALDSFVSDSGTRTRVNDVATEAANAEEPQGAYNAGTMVEFTDTGDGSGDGLYIIDRNEAPQGPV
ncbi:hypothetical protein HATV-3_gp36 [Haloarcula tailed virus 3]|uniref:Uncharacterized protein n=1 Tax=Haloarcula tailed virus 3 TaxID=2877990 RepID=A0AAE8XZJ2_9CAUD|nr:baseplate protein [Haloarcula tailed virus 3]UBF23386.1 hypothetical protein HATV-3_gp36 [Haloarcula tailed virus 3]